MKINKVNSTVKGNGNNFQINNGNNNQRGKEKKRSWVSVIISGLIAGLKSLFN